MSRPPLPPARLDAKYRVRLSGENRGVSSLAPVTLIGDDSLTGMLQTPACDGRDMYQRCLLLASAASWIANTISSAVEDSEASSSFRVLLLAPMTSWGGPHGPSWTVPSMGG